MYICVDFDGTIVDHVFPDIGQPVPDAIKWMKEWKEHGAKLILFTMRSDVEEGDYLTQAVNYLKSHNILLHGINHNPDQASWTSSPKAYGNVYIDDAAFGCPMIKPFGFNRECVDWRTVGPMVKTMLIKGEGNG